MGLLDIFILYSDAGIGQKKTDRRRDKVQSVTRPPIAPPHIINMIR